MPQKKPQYPSAQRIGERVRRVRESQRLSTAALGEKTGYSQQQISQVELGRINTPVETYARIASALDVPLSTFFCDGGEEEDSTVAQIAAECHETVNEYYNLGRRLMVLEDKLSQKAKTGFFVYPEPLHFPGKHPLSLAAGVA